MLALDEEVDLPGVREGGPRAAHVGAHAQHAPSQSAQVSAVRHGVSSARLAGLPHIVSLRHSAVHL